MAILKPNKTIRQATPEDVPRMIALEAAAVTAAHWREDDYHRIFERGSVPRVALVFEHADTLAGFLLAMAAGDEWEIENVVVAECHKRCGIGFRLVSELVSIARAQGAKAVFLEVRESNTAARKLYDKCDFGIAGRRRSYYRDPQEDALIYSLRLPPLSNPMKQSIEIP